MKTYFVQLTNHIFEKQQVLLSGAILAENEEEAKKKAIEIASRYQAITEIDAKLGIYTLIELTDESPAQFSVEHRR